jgi:hypothetical protein
MIANLVQEVADYLKQLPATTGILQVDTCETEQIFSTNNVLVEFDHQDRKSTVISCVVSADGCFKTLRLADIIKIRLEGRYRWLKSEALQNKKCVCDRVKIWIELPEAAPPPNYETNNLLPQIFDVNLSIGFCAPPTREKVELSPLQEITAAVDCCSTDTSGFEVLARFTAADLREGIYVANITPGGFFIRNNLGAIHLPTSVRLVGLNTYAITPSTAVEGEWTITRG